MIGHFEDPGIKYVQIACRVPGATIDAWMAWIHIGLGFMELTFWSQERHKQVNPLTEQIISDCDRVIAKTKQDDEGHVINNT